MAMWDYHKKTSSADLQAMILDTARVVLPPVFCPIDMVEALTDIYRAEADGYAYRRILKEMNRLREQGLLGRVYVSRGVSAWWFNRGD